MTTDILISQYELSSGWKEKHRILTEMEDSSPEVLKNTIERSVFAYKLRNIELIILEKEVELKNIYESSKSDNSYYILLDEVKKLDLARMHFSKKLTRVFSH